MSDMRSYGNHLTLRACFKFVAADVRRRILQGKWPEFSASLPRRLRGFRILKHPLSSPKFMGATVRLWALALLALFACASFAADDSHAYGPEAARASLANMIVPDGLEVTLF